MFWSFIFHIFIKSILSESQAFYVMMRGPAYSSPHFSFYFITITACLFTSRQPRLQMSPSHIESAMPSLCCSFVLYFQDDMFVIEAVDLGYIHKILIRHDNALLNPSWFLDRVEVIDKNDNERTFVFLCERWLSRNKDDKRIKRTLYEKSFEVSDLMAVRIRNKSLCSSQLNQLSDLCMNQSISQPAYPLLITFSLLTVLPYLQIIKTYEIFSKLQ